MADRQLESTCDCEAQSHRGYIPLLDAELLAFFRSWVVE